MLVRPGESSLPNCVSGRTGLGLHADVAFASIAASGSEVRITHELLLIADDVIE